MGKSIFLSHNSDDKSFVRRLADDLTTAGAKVWFAEGEIEIGDSLLGKIEKGIGEADYLAVILSPNSINSKWVQIEVNAALSEEIIEKRIKVLPLYYKTCKMPAFLRDKVYADFRDEKKYSDSLKKVIKKLGLLSPAKEAEILIKKLIEGMGSVYIKTHKIPSINGLIQLSKSAGHTVALKIIIESSYIQYDNKDERFIYILANEKEILNWKSTALPVIVVWISENHDPLWTNTKFVKLGSRKIKISKKTVFGTDKCIKELLNIVNRFSGNPDIQKLTQHALFPKQVSDIKNVAWQFYAEWRNDGSHSPVFGKVEITLKGWRHITRVSLSQHAIIHKLTLLPCAKELIETATESHFLRRIGENISLKELHALRGLYQPKFKTNVLVEVVLEVMKRGNRVISTKLYSIQEKRSWYE